MSSAVLYVFVERSNDRNVYSQLADKECQDGTPYRVVTAEELSSGAGAGKQTLLQYFDYLKKCSSLIDNLGSKKTVSVFLLDKDLDDLKGTRRRSVHVVYTETYDIEAYYFIYGDLCRSASTASGLDIDSRRYR